LGGKLVREAAEDFFPIDFLALARLMQIFRQPICKIAVFFEVWADSEVRYALYRVSKNTTASQETLDCTAFHSPEKLHQSSLDLSVKYRHRGCVLERRGHIHAAAASLHAGILEPPFPLLLE
jgi:hypothetical protein